MSEKEGGEKTMFRKVFCTVSGVLLATPAFAAVTLPTAISVTDVESLAGLVLTALAVIWGIRKLIKLTNRS